MTTRRLTVITDDLDGTQGATTHTFSLSGTTYEIDLTESNAAELRAALEPYITAARRTVKHRRARR